MRSNGFWETAGFAIHTVRTNPLRSSLTSLGIVVGVAMVIAISSVINGLNDGVATMIRSLGANVLFVFRFPVFATRPTSEMLTRKQLTYEDAVALQAMPHIVAVSPVLRYSGGNGGATVVRGGGKALQNIALEGTTSSIADIRELTLRDGRFLNNRDQENIARVAVLGYDTAEEMFGEGQGLGTEISIAGMVFTVVGVLDKQKQALGNGKNADDYKIIVPISTFHRLHPEVRDYWITLKCDQPKNQAVVEEEVTELLRQRRHVANADENSFAVFGTEAIMRLWTGVTSGLFLLLIALSSVALLVGGIGVMNVMLVTVTERTREIGIRKAIGATNLSILRLFALEAVLLCAAGGVLGVGVGVGGTALIRIVLPAELSARWVFIGLTSACITGLVFGIYPAWKAANLNPIEALRHE